MLEELAGAVLPGADEIFIGPGSLGSEDRLDPVGEGAGRGELAGEVGVVEVAMGVDEPREEDGIAEIQELVVGGADRGGPRFYGEDPSVEDPDDPIGDGRSGDRDDVPGSEQDGAEWIDRKKAGRWARLAERWSWERLGQVARVFSLVRAATLWVRDLVLLCLRRIWPSSFLVVESIAA